MTQLRAEEVTDQEKALTWLQVMIAWLDTGDYYRDDQQYDQFRSDLNAAREFVFNR